QLLADRSSRRGQPPGTVEEVGNFPQQPQVDLHVARLGLDYDSEQDRVIVLADDQAALERGASPAFRMEVSRDQALSTMRVIEAAVAGGRPLCPLCHQALEYEGQEHFCPGGNGHSKEIELPPLDSDDDEIE